MSLQTPILFLVFNRPDTTKRVFDEIRKQKPQKLFIAADGPRLNNSEDFEKCKKVKEIFEGIDWPCEIKTLYRTNNLGCKIAVSQGIDWFYENVEEGIILEDDILPDPSFFSFCEAMLSIYRDDDQVMHISGFNPLYSWKDKVQSYHFSYFGNIWGWATWKKAWNSYDVNIKQWNDKNIQKKLLKTFFPASFRADRKKLYDDLFKGEIDTWDYQWTLCRLFNNGKSIISSINMIENIGFNEQATHTKVAPQWAKNKKTEMTLPYKHPNFIEVDKAYDISHLNLNRVNQPKKNKLFILKYLNKIKPNKKTTKETISINQVLESPHKAESQVLLKNQYLMMKKLDILPSFNETGFSVYSQHEEDGLLLFIFSIIGVTNKTVVEICAGNGKECNAANLIINHKWKGLLFDGNKQNVQEGDIFFNEIKSSTFWPPKFVHAWITRHNINQLIEENSVDGEIDLLSIDIDGNDWYLLKDLHIVNPRVIVLEINHLLGPEKTLSVPYSDDFKAVFTEYGSDYAGASLNAFVLLCKQKNYRLIGTNEIGTNAFFIRNDIGLKEFPEKAPFDCLQHPRAIFGQTVRYEKIKDMDWIDVKQYI